jgi:hypothetical protein
MPAEKHKEAVARIRQVSDESFDGAQARAKLVGYDTALSEGQTNLDWFKEFSQWEFENYGIFRAGDETFMVVRKEVRARDVSPNIVEEMQAAMTEGYNVRVGTAVARADQELRQVIRNADVAVKVSKELGDVSIRRTQKDEVEIVNMLIVNDGREDGVGEVETLTKTFSVREDGVYDEKGNKLGDEAEKILLDRLGEKTKEDRIAQIIGGNRDIIERAIKAIRETQTKLSECAT